MRTPRPPRAMRLAAPLAGLLLLLASAAPWASEPVIPAMPPPDAHPVSTLGAKPLVTILVRFSDYTGITPHPKSWFQGMIGDTAYASANHYFREISYGRMNLDGSAVYGWYNLAHPRSYYNTVNAEGDSILLTELILDEAIAKVDASVNFNNFHVINVLMNVNPCTPPFTTSTRRTLDGTLKDWWVTIFGPWGIDRVDVTTHETMHTYGVHHSSGPYNDCPRPQDCIYDSQWDRMSAASPCNGQFPPDPTYGCMGVHTIAWHKHELDWIDDARVWDSGLSRAGMVRIERLAKPLLATGTRAYVKLRWGGSTALFHTAEYRNWHGYDGLAGVPAEAVVLHAVDTGRSDRQAQVVDPDGDHNVNDDAASWVPGETFEDATNAIVVHVESTDDAEATVSVSNKRRTTVYVDRVWVGFEDGQSGSPWNSLVEGYASASRSGTVLLKPGTYAENLRLSKPCRLQRNGTTGTVVIGQ